MFVSKEEVTTYVTDICKVIDEQRMLLEAEKQKCGNSFFAKQWNKSRLSAIEKALPQLAQIKTNITEVGNRTAALIEKKPSDPRKTATAPKTQSEALASAINSNINDNPILKDSAFSSLKTAIQPKFDKLVDGTDMAHQKSRKFKN